MKLLDQRRKVEHLQESARQVIGTRWRFKRWCRTKRQGEGNVTRRLVGRRGWRRQSITLVKRFQAIAQIRIEISQILS